mmetsp:Transcript_5467/g.15217  ORF Transcript_5467/g.15217 Transcript_5467/m.15217 type:complete len:223 (+) Transcript_5467:287-955(+)
MKVLLCLVGAALLPTALPVCADLGAKSSLRGNGAAADAAVADSGPTVPPEEDRGEGESVEVMELQDDEDEVDEDEVDGDESAVDEPQPQTPIGDLSLRALQRTPRSAPAIFAMALAGGKCNGRHYVYLSRHPKMSYARSRALAGCKKQCARCEVRWAKGRTDRQWCIAVDLYNDRRGIKFGDGPIALNPKYHRATAAMRKTCHKRGKPPNCDTHNLVACAND